MAPPSSVRSLRVKKEKNASAMIGKKEKSATAMMGKSAMMGRKKGKGGYEEDHIRRLQREIMGWLRDCEVQVVIVVADSYSQKSHFLPRYIGDAVGPGKKVACAYFSAQAGMMAAQWPPGLGNPTTLTLTGRQSHAALEFMSVNHLLQRMLKPNYKGGPDRDDLSSFSAVYVDAAHHRTLTTDVVLASLLPHLVRRRTGPNLLRLVLGVAPSAAHEADKLSAFFAPHCSTKACVLPLSSKPPPPPIISYLAPPPGDEESGEFVLSVILELHRSSQETHGSILLFLARGSVDRAALWVQHRIAESSNPKDKTLQVVPLHTGADWEVSATTRPPPPAPAPGRCLYILSPEVPDASPQLHGVSYVVDPGKATLGGRLRRISQQSATERAAHLDPRFGAPKCLRLYPESVFHGEMPRTTTPDILTCDAHELSVALGKMKLLGLTDPWTFNFIDPPPPKALAYAVELMAPLPDLSRLSLACP